MNRKQRTVNREQRTGNRAQRAGKLLCSLIMIICCLLVSCPDGVKLLDVPNIPEGYGVARISFQGSAGPENARTAIPAAALENFHLEFEFSPSGAPGDPINPEPATINNGVYEFYLELGEYTLTVNAYLKDDNGDKIDSLVATGDTTIEITEGTPANATVVLEPFTENGTGTLEFTFDYDSNVINVEFLTLRNLFGGGDAANILLDLNQSTGTGSINDLEAGYYFLQAGFRWGFQLITRSKVVHIYQNLTTIVEFEVDDDDFSYETDTYIVYNSADEDTAGTLRHAIGWASEMGEITIQIMLASDSKIVLGDTLDVSGEVTILTQNDVIIERADGFLGAFFSVTGGGKLTLSESGASSTLTLDGGKDNGITAQAALISVSGANSELVMNDGVTLQNNANTYEPTGSGVIVSNSASFTMSGNASIHSNEIESVNKDNDGGGVLVISSTFTMNDTASVYNNKAKDSGGGVSVIEGTFTMNDSASVYGNEAANGGGVIVSFQGVFDMRGDAKITDNNTNIAGTGTSQGGGVYVVTTGTFTMSGNAEVSGNTATGYNGHGGGVYAGGTFTMSGNSDVSGNTAAATGSDGIGNGGGVFVAGTFIMEGGTVSGNTNSYEGKEGGGQGGGVTVFGNSANFTMSGGSIYDNSTFGAGGGVYVRNEGSFTMNGGSVSDNTSNNSGGGVSVWEKSTFAMSGDAEIFGNKAGTVSTNVSGGGVSINDSAFTMGGDAKVFDNTASSGGGVVASNNSAFTMSGNAEVSGNTANGNTNGNGGGVYISQSTFIMSGNAEVSGNNANTNGGGVFLTRDNFQITGGTVYGANEGANSNTAPTGAALYTSNNLIAQYGTFDGDDWVSAGDIPLPGTWPSGNYTDDTIIVVDGVLKLNGEGTELSPLLIYTATQLQAISLELDKHYRLETDINLEGINWTPIGNDTTPFTGTFDGNYKIIRNLTINNLASDYQQGLFGYIESAVVKNLGLIGGSITGYNYVGAVVGNNNGTVQNCFSTVSVSGNNYVGGIVGYNTDSTSMVQNCYSTGSVTGAINVGGVVGMNTGTVQNCYSTGEVVCRMFASYLTVEEVGGVVGLNASSVINSVALNPSITRVDDTDTTFGRVGNNFPGNTLTNNYARSDMLMPSGITLTKTATGKDGEDITETQWNSATFWENTVLFPENEWEFRAGLPILKEFAAGTQDPVVELLPTTDITLYYEFTGNDPEGTTINLPDGTFGSTPSYITITVYNSGWLYPTSDLTVALSGADADSFTLSPITITSIPPSEASKTFNIGYISGLDVGTYTATVTVSGDNVISKSFTVSFTVLPTHGGGDITINLWANEDDQILDGDYSDITIQPDEQFTVNVDVEYDEIRYTVWGYIDEETNDSSFIIDAADFDKGTHKLVVIAYKGGVPYSTEISFTVTD